MRLLSTGRDMGRYEGGALVSAGQRSDPVAEGGAQSAGQFAGWMTVRHFPIAVSISCKLGFRPFWR